ncbi:MAG: YcaO-like family protein [Oscillospiraceae bacterium]|nr:YcaO-like family protein [Oscillospiraceae bacterium]
MTTISENMTHFTDNLYKDSTPMATVRRIQDILRQNGLTTTEHWHEVSVPYCHAMSVHLDGYTLKTNGKGLSRELAMASGYGELMERLQLGLTGNTEYQKSNVRADRGRDTVMDAHDLLAKNPDRYEILAQRLAQCTGINTTPEAILKRFTDPSGKISTREYIHLGTGRREYLPTGIVQRIYGTNGCAAGNTAEEALVQAISEVMERHHQMRIIHEGLTPPDIPAESLTDYKAACAIMDFLRSNGFKVLVKDCSLGTNFPVVCVCLIDEKTGRYHTHFGAFPVFEIALERALTESFQGRNLQNVASFLNFELKKPGQHSLITVGNEASYGSWEKSPDFFSGTPSYPYNPNAGMRGGSNKELLRQCVDFLTRQGREILVRDYSVLDFPTYQVIIPGFSEVLIHRLHQNTDDSRFANDAAMVLRNPAKAPLPAYLSLIMHLQQLDQLGSKIRQAYNFPVCARLSAQPDRTTAESLMIATLCYIHYAMGRNDEVIKGLDRLLALTQDETTGQLICLRRYLTLAGKGYDADQIRGILETFHPESVTQRLYGCLENKRNPFDGFVLHCDQEHCDGCKLYDTCFQKRSRALSALIAQKAAVLDTDAFAAEMANILK